MLIYCEEMKEKSYETWPKREIRKSLSREDCQKQLTDLEAQASGTVVYAGHWLANGKWRLSIWFEDPGDVVIWDLVDHG